MLQRRTSKSALTRLRRDVRGVSHVGATTTAAARGATAFSTVETGADATMREADGPVTENGRGRASRRLPTCVRPGRSAATKGERVTRA